jgi:NADPH:quinone reductase-like Zn-dependent oxidoreductase
MARLAGHNVTATCGARNLGFVRGLGADEVLDYKNPEGAALRSPSGRRYDVVVHCAKGVPWKVFRPVLADAGLGYTHTSPCRTRITTIHIQYFDTLIFFQYRIKRRIKNIIK